MIELARQYGSYGYRRVAALLREAGWQVSDGRVERLWKREGLKVPSKQPKKSRIWLNDGSCIRLRPCWRNHVWAYDFVMDRTHDGCALTPSDHTARWAIVRRHRRRSSRLSCPHRLRNSEHKLSLYKWSRHRGLVRISAFDKWKVQ